MTKQQKYLKDVANHSILFNLVFFENFKTSKIVIVKLLFC